MRQILLNANGAVIARMPKPVVERGCVLVETSYSLVSVGTETSPLVTTGAGGKRTPLGRARALSQVSMQYLGKAVRDPRKAAERVAQISKRTIRQLQPKVVRSNSQPQPLNGLEWRRAKAVEFHAENSQLRYSADKSAYAYQCITQDFPVSAGHAVVVTVTGKIEGSPVCLGVLAGGGGGWIGSVDILPGEVDDSFLFCHAEGGVAAIVFANAGADEPAKIDVNVSAQVEAPSLDGLPVSEADQQGWAVGYSLAGTVLAIGAGVDDLRPGDRVACAGAGAASHADFVSVRRNLVCRVPDDCDLKWAATATVGAIAMQGVRRAEVRVGERVCVIGLGLIGQLTCQILRASGCKVVGYDLDAARAERALQHSADAATSDHEMLSKIIRDMSHGHGVDAVILTAATKSSDPVNFAFDICRRRGRVVLVGDMGLNLERSVFYKKEIDVLMSTSYGPGRYDPAYEDQGHDYPISYVRWTLNRNLESYMELIAGGKIRPELVVDLVAPVEDSPEVYKNLIAGGKDTPMGVLFDYTEKPVDPEPGSAIHLRGGRAPRTGPANSLLVGVGAFGVSMLLPIMAKLPKYFNLAGVVSRDAVRGGNFARSNALSLLASDLGAALEEPNVDLVVICTRHNRHADQVIEALKHGKHVFVEKPLALSWEDLDRVQAAYAAAPGQPVLMVGFNRRFSPAIQCLAAELKGRRGPLMVNYRLNGGYIPLDHWIQTSEGGGRNIGEACHMYDVFRMLTGSPVTSIEATPIDVSRSHHLPTDNFSTSLRYEDGSVCTLMYTALGPKKGISKEYIEVFSGDEAWVIDDYKSLRRVSTGDVLWQSSDADKGHSEEFQRLGLAISGEGPAPIPLDEIFEVSATALAINDLLTGHE